MREKVYRKLTKSLAYDFIADSEGQEQRGIERRNVNENFSFTSESKYFPMRPSLKWNVKLEIYINIDLGFLTN